MDDNGSVLPKATRGEMVRNPKGHFDGPDKLIEDRRLTQTEKKKALEVWEQDAQQLLTASNEGMTDSEEGLDPDHSPKLGEIVRAKSRMGEKPKRKVTKPRRVGTGLGPSAAVDQRRVVSFPQGLATGIATARRSALLGQWYVRRQDRC